VHTAPSWYSITKFPSAKKGDFCTSPKLEYLKQNEIDEGKKTDEKLKKG